MPQEEAAEQYFKEHLEPILASAGANYVYEVAHASNITVQTPRSIGEVRQEGLVLSYP